MLKIYQWIKSRFQSPYSGYEGTKFVRPGVKIWELTIATGDVVEAEYSLVKVQGRETKRVMMKPGCVYIDALNGENAVRKFEQKIVKHYGSN